MEVIMSTRQHKIKPLIKKCPKCGSLDVIREMPANRTRITTSCLSCGYSFTIARSVLVKRAEHTPTPWTVVNKIGLHFLGRPIGTCNGENRRITKEKSDQENAANATFICCAVNNFDGLLSACKQALKKIIPEYDNEAMDVLRDAINKAEAPDAT